MRLYAAGSSLRASASADDEARVTGRKAELSASAATERPREVLLEVGASPRGTFPAEICRPSWTIQGPSRGGSMNTMGNALV